jgi:D-3-phosphoglycerate dehydrogenase
MARRVVVTDHVFENLDIERTVLAPLGLELVQAPGTSEEELVDAVRDDGVEALLVCYAQVRAPVIAAAAQAGCKLISRYGIGYDNIDIEAARRAGIPVTYVPDYCLDEVADHTFTLLLALARHLVVAANDVRAGGWALPHGAIRRIRGRRLALIGLGAIGRRVAVRAQAFGLELTAFDPYVDATEWPEIDIAPTPEAAVAEADFVSLHTPLTDATRHLVDAPLIDHMRRAPILINTARGGLVDLDAVVHGLDSGKLSGVGLDVTEVEPLPSDHPLRSRVNAVITPHMAFHSIEAQEELRRRAAEEVGRALRGEPPDRLVPGALSASATR